MRETASRTDEWLKLAVVAPRIGRSPAAVRLLIKSGALRAVQHIPRGTYYVRESECDRYLAELESASLAALPA